MTIDPSSTKVLVTGAGSYIGLHTILQLLEQGYNVRGTLRRKDQAEHVKATLSEHVSTDNLEFAFAELMKDAGWRDAVKGCDYVLHLASPYPALDPKDENEVIFPAREGTLRVLRVAHDAGVKRVVIMSSFAAMAGGNEGQIRVFDHTVWTNLEKCRNVYSKSKAIAERAAWDYVNSPENTNKVELASINPPHVFGPVLDDHFHTAMEWFTSLMRREVPGMAKFQLNIVDVRDVVDATIRAMITPEAAGERFIVHSESILLPDFAKILHENFAHLGYRIPTMTLPDPLVRFFSLFIPKTKYVADALGWRYTLSTEKAKSILGWEPRPINETIIAMGESLIEKKIV